MGEINDAAMESFVVSEEVRQKFQPILEAMGTQVARLTSLPDVVRVRPGFQHTSAGVLPALVLSAMPPLSDRSQRDAAALAARLECGCGGRGGFAAGPTGLPCDGQGRAAFRLPRLARTTARGVPRRSAEDMCRPQAPTRRSLRRWKSR